MDNYVPTGVTNATVQILGGQVELSLENGDRLVLNANDTAPLPTSSMHTIRTTSSVPASYMYTFVGLSKVNASGAGGGDVLKKPMGRVTLMTPFVKSLALVGQSLLNLLFGIPLVATGHK